MKKFFKQWHGENFPVREVNLPESWGYYNPVNVADVELWWAIEEDCNNGNEEAIEIDNSIFFFCDTGFIESDPTDEEIIKYLQTTGL